MRVLQIITERQINKNVSVHNIVLNIYICIYGLDTW